jgi:hypothetical protein
MRVPSIARIPRIPIKIWVNRPDKVETEEETVPRTVPLAFYEVGAD